MMLLTAWTAARSRFAGWLAAAGVALAAIGLAATLLGAAYVRGKRDAAANQTEQRLETIKKARKVEDEVDQMGPAVVDARLREWMRDGG